jgi:glycosyltransferase involved in cell wall biosynthesis
MEWVRLCVVARDEPALRSFWRATGARTRSRPDISNAGYFVRRGMHLFARRSPASARRVYIVTAKVLFYDDAPNFGGHELMTMRLVEQMDRQSRYEIAFVTSEVNVELRRQIEKYAPAVRILLQPYASGRGQWLRTYVSMMPLLRLLRLLRREQPDLLVVVQGGIALSSLGILAGRMAGVRTISYLPMTHDESMFAPTPLLARLRQWLVQPFYSLPDCLVTISPRMAENAERRRRGVVKVVENGIEFADFRADRRDAVRSELGLCDNDRLLLMVGRIEFGQKRHDLAVQALAMARARAPGLHLLVVGSGPDEPELRAQVQALGLENAVHWRAWQGDVTAFYAACDAVLLPSRYEGVPLVMLEAMHAGRCILASNVDGMADMLPPAWTFTSGDAGSLADLLCVPKSPADAEHLQRYRKLMRAQYTLDAFGRRFLSVIDHELALCRG